MGAVPGPLCRSGRRSVRWFVILLLAAVGSPVAAQGAGEGGRHVVAALQAGPHLHAFEAGFGLGARAGIEWTRWSVGLAAYRSLNDIDNAPAPQHTLGPDNPLVQAEHFREIRLLGLYGSRVVHQKPSARLTLDLQLGALSFVRRTEAYEFVGYAPDGTPVSLGDIGTAREVNAFVEPSLRYERDLGRGLRLQTGAGYQWSTRPWSGYASFDAFTLSAGVAACMTCSEARLRIGLPAFLLAVIGGMLIDTSEPAPSGTLGQEGP